MHAEGPGWKNVVPSVNPWTSRYYEDKVVCLFLHATRTSKNPFFEIDDGHFASIITIRAVGFSFNYNVPSTYESPPVYLMWMPRLLINVTLLVFILLDQAKKHSFYHVYMHAEGPGWKKVVPSVNPWMSRYYEDKVGCLLLPTSSYVRCMLITRIYYIVGQLLDYSLYA